MTSSKTHNTVNAARKTRVGKKKSKAEICFLDPNEARLTHECLLPRLEESQEDLRDILTPFERVVSRRNSDLESDSQLADLFWTQIGIQGSFAEMETLA
jgi:hypothetical protein